MKKLISGLIFLTLCGIANAGQPHYHYRPHHHGNSHWVAPLILGGVLGAVIANQMQPQPQIIHTLPPPPYGYRYVQIFDYYCNCSKWALMAIQ